MGKGQEYGNEEFWYEVFSDTSVAIVRTETMELLPNGPEVFDLETGKTVNGIDVRGPVYSAETYLGKVWWKIVKIDTDSMRTMTIQIIESKSKYFLKLKINVVPCNSTL